jgi:hypothetical protein
MNEYVQIYGANVRMPDRPIDEDALNYGRPRKEQKWERGELPAMFDKVEYTKEGKLKLTAEQDAYAEIELGRCRTGVWMWIGERMRYITGRYYFYLKYYVLEDGNAPEFREADRLYFLFWQHWFLILWCLGIIRIKKRRQGASSQSCSNILYEAIFFKNSNCGLLSKTRDDSKATFTEMVTNAYQLLPPFFKPRLQGREESVTELVLLHDKGALSKINYKAPVLNAYDRGRMSYVLLDEGGKYPLDVPTSRLIAIISKTLSKGVKRVGWLDAPSTVNELTKGGGAEYKKVFDAANQFKRSITLNRFVRFFQPAYEAYEGFIDEFGDSVVDAPTEEQYEYLVNKWVQRNEEGELISEISEDDVRLGAKVYVMYKRRDGLEGTDLEEEVRMNPCDEDEAFMYAGQGCEFNAPNILRQIKELEDDKPFLRQMRLVPESRVVKSIFPGVKDIEDIISKPIDDTKGGWFILELPNKANHFIKRGSYYEPLNKSMYQIGVDTTKDMATVNGSKPVIIVFKKSCIVNGEETGMYPVAMWIAETRLDIHFDEQVLLACKLYGCTANYEIDARGDYYRYFCKENCQSMLEWTPMVARNPVKKNNKIEPGTRSGDPFQLSTQLQIGKMYIDGTDNEVYNGHAHRIKYITLLKQLLKYDHANRTPFDQCIALFMCLLPIFGEQQNPIIPQRPRQILPTYKIAAHPN